ncbi:MAG: DegV family protein [Lachnospiraceae bacterium]|nr:DegV family protein [Lachnospiraceae bacterium]
MNVAIMTDSNSGIAVDEAEKLGIFSMPMPVIIDGRDFIEGVNLSRAKFFEILAIGADVSTSQPSPGELMDMWDDILSKGYDEIVYIPMSSGLSSSARNSEIFASEYDGRVVVVDNHRISVTQRQSVMDAIVLADAGMKAEDIKKRLEETAYDSVVYLAVDTLDYLKKTGRVNATAATVGSVLGIKPVLKTTGGNFEVCTAVRGIKKAASKIIEAMRDELETRFSAFAHEDLIIGTAGSFVDQVDAGNWNSVIKEAFPDIEVYYNKLSCSVSAHTGPNAMGVGISRKLKA